MAINQGQIQAVGATRIAVGLSAIIALQPSASETGLIFKLLSTGGTLEIVPIPSAISQALTGASAIGWGLGYPVGAAETISITNGSPTVYLAASGGVTAVIAAQVQFSTGITLVKA